MWIRTWSWILGVTPLTVSAMSEPSVAARSSAPRFSAGAVRAGVVLLTLLLVALSYLDRVCISSAAPTIQGELGLDDGQMGLVFSAFTLTYALLEIPSGWFADCFGPRAALSRVVVWWSAMTAATGLASGFASLLVLRALFGAGEAGAFPALARVYDRWLPPSGRGRAFGLAIMTGALGGAITQPLVVFLLGRMSWRAAFAIFGAIGLVWAAAWWVCFRDDPRDHPWIDPRERDGCGARAGSDKDGAASRAGREHAHRVPWPALLGSRTLLTLCLIHLCVIYGWYFFLTWMPTYLLRARGYDLTAAGARSALPLLGIAAGVATGGWLADFASHRLGPRQGRRVPALIGLPAAAVVLTAGVLTADAERSALLFALAAGLAAMGVPAAWTTCIDIGGPHAGVVSGAMNMAGNIGGALSPVVFGACLKAGWSWTVPLLGVAALYLVAAAAWLTVDATRTLDAAPGGT